jgi:hypothetical protein
MTSRRFGGLSTALVALALGALVWLMAAASGVPGGYSVLLALVAVGAYLDWKHRQYERHQRWADLRVVARVRKELGLAYERNLPEKRMRRYFSLPLFDSRSSFGHLMSGPAGEGRVLLFDYRGRTVILFPDVGLPEFELRPPRRWGFLGQPVRFDPEELPDEVGRQLMRFFTRFYTVESPNEGEVRPLFSREKVCFFVGHPGWEVQSYAGHLLLFKGRKKVPLGLRPALFREALALARQFHPPLCPECPWAGRTVPASWGIQLKPARFKGPRPMPGPSRDERFVSSE